MACSNGIGDNTPKIPGNGWFRDLPAQCLFCQLSPGYQIKNGALEPPKLQHPGKMDLHHIPLVAIAYATKEFQNEPGAQAILTFFIFHH